MPFDSQNYQPTDPVLKCLEDARQWLSDPGHWYHADFFCGGNGETCAVGAVNKIALGKPDTLDENEVSRAAVRLLEEAMPSPVTNPHWPAPHAPARHVPWYNDAYTTTHADILALFDRAIAARRAELLAEQMV